MYFVYVLQSQKNHRLYTGSTDDIQRRLFEHNAGKSKATQNTRPFKLLHFEQFETRSEAIRRERFLKTGVGRDELKYILSRKDRLGP